MTAYKVLSNLPLLNKGDIIEKESNSWFCKGKMITYLSFLTTEECSGYFAKYLFTTVDGVPIFQGDNYWLAANEKATLYDTHSGRHHVGCTYSTKEAAEKSLLPKYPKSFEELPLVKGFDVVYRVEPTEKYKRATHSSPFYTKAQANSMLAFAKLSQIIAAMNDGWEADWEADGYKYTIDRFANGLIKDWGNKIFKPLAFATEEARDFSFEHHNELWREYYQL